MQVYAFDLVPWPYLEEASYYPDPNRLYDPPRGRQVYDEHLRQMEMYEAFGYDAICINEHHAKPYGLMPSPNLMAAALTQRTKRIKIYMFQKLLSYHRGSMKLLGQSAPPRPAEIRSAEDLPFYEFDFDLCQKEGISIIGDPDYVAREIQRQMRELGAGVFMGLFSYGSMPDEIAQKNIRLFGEKVLPALKRG